MVTILVTIALFVTREYIETRRRRKQSSTVLALYGYSALRALERSTRGKLHFTMKDVLESARDVIHIESTRVLVSALDAALYAIELADVPGALPAREDRQRLAAELGLVLSSHVKASRLPITSLGVSKVNSSVSQQAIK